MGWTVKQWRTDGLERLLTEAARESVRETREAAERDARRARRAADRTAADATAQLIELERLCFELQRAVQGQRATLRTAPPQTPTLAAVDLRTTGAAPNGRGTRASLRTSGLRELFRATVGG